MATLLLFVELLAPGRRLREQGNCKEAAIAIGGLKY
jgi:hypothetical protein